MALDETCVYCGPIECPQCHREEASVIVTKDAKKVYCYACRFEVDLEMYEQLLEDYHRWVKTQQKSSIDV
jgi:hypothetical protein